MPSPRAGRLAAAAVLAFVPATLLAASEHGRTLAHGDFLQLYTVALPAAGVLVLLGTARLLTSPGPRLGAVLHGLVAIAGTALAFQGVRLLSTFWLAWNRGLVIGDPGLLLAAAGGLLWLVGGVFGLTEGTRLGAGAGTPARRAALLCGLGAISVPLLPWFVLDGQGTAPLIFNDLVEPAYSSFPVQPAAVTALVTIAGSLAAGCLLLTAVGTWRSGPRWLRSMAGLLALAGAATGYALYVLHAQEMDAAFQAGTVRPLFNYLPGLFSLLAGWQAMRKGRPGASGGVEQAEGSAAMST